MRRHYTLLSLLTVFIVVIAVFGGIMLFKTAGLPFQVDIVDTRMAVIQPIAGIPLPEGLKAGDVMELAAQPPATRDVIGINTLSAYLQGALPSGHHYEFVIERDGGEISVPVDAVSLLDAVGLRAVQWVSFLQTLTLTVFTLLVLWRGNDRAAAGLALWTFGNVVGGAAIYPLDGMAGLALTAVANLGFGLARIGFYVMADAIAQPIVSPQIRRLYRMTFVLILAVGAAFFSIGGPIIYALTGWAGGVLPVSGLLWTASYLIPILLLFSTYQHADSAQRLRLRWMLWSSVIWLVGIFVSNTPVLSVQFSVTFTDVGQLLGVMGFLYSVLRHRVVDVSVLIDRTLVYGATTALVVGVVAAMNSLALRATLGEGAGLLLQVVVPLSLGIVLTRVRAFLDRVVERVFFRRKYLADKALRRFARLAPSYEHPNALLAAAMENIRQHLGARGVAVYERRGEDYVCVHREGEVAYPARVKTDDTAFVAARAHQDDIDLAELDSALGADGSVFPMAAHGELQAVLVCANLPGERYPTDERALLAHVAHQMGMALYVLRMEAKAKVVDALAKAPFTALAELQAQARVLAGAATVS